MVNRKMCSVADAPNLHASPRSHAAPDAASNSHAVPDATPNAHACSHCIEHEEMNRTLLEQIISQHETIVTQRNAIAEYETTFNCIVCFDKPRAVLVLPCGHFVMCSQCASEIAMCPTCRNCIDERKLAFFN